MGNWTVLKRGSSDGYGVLYLQVVFPACMYYLAIVQVVCAIIHSCILCLQLCVDLHAKMEECVQTT